jgi:hypothetical protein
MRMRTRGHLPWHLIPVLGAGLAAAVLTAQWAAPPPGTATARPPARRAAAAAAPAPAADSAIRLQALLGRHAVLASTLMRSRIRGDDDFVQAANAALGENTDAMTALTGQLFGAETGRRFGPLWSEHVVSVVDYAAALADQDEAARARARVELDEYEAELADFFAAGSRGRLSRAAASDAVAVHVEHLTGQADAYAARRYADADRIYRHGYAHASDLALTLADALLPARDRAVLRQPLWRLRSQLGKLLAEHVVLVTDVSRAASAADAPDFAAAGRAVNDNTGALASAMDTLFGAAAARDFQALWATHVEHLVAYAGAAAAGDRAARERARAGLGDVEQRMAAFLSGATGGRVSSADLSAALLSHDRMLLRHADAYAARDYPGAHAVAQQTYDHMFDLARTLADAFGATVAARLPRGGAQTGHGGLAGGPGG